MPEQRVNFTVSQVQFELAESIALLKALSRELKFLSKGPKQKIFYLIDYPEICAYWESRRPQTTKQLRDDDGAQRVWEYITGLERIFLDLDEDKTRLAYVQRAYEEQAEYIDALLLNPDFETMIAPPTWRLIQDDIVYMTHLSDDPSGNWNFVIQQNEAQLKERIGIAPSSNYSESMYVSDAERFGFASLQRKPVSNVRDIFLPFITDANFRDPTDLRWEPLCANDGETSFTREFRVGGVGEP
jgi:hypothetical protein